jgi:hypothetical protein
MRTLNAELKWAGMNRIRETPDMFLFYYSRRTAYFLPKRVVGPAADSAGLAEWIRTRLPSDVAYITPKLSAGRGTRTPKGRSPPDFESGASTNSTIPANDE